MEAENAVAEAPKGTGKIVSAGAPISFRTNIPLPDNNGENQQNQNTNVPQGTSKEEGQEGNAAAPAKTEAEIAAELKLSEDAKNAGTQATNEPPKPLTDEELKAEYEKRFPTQAALTDEQKIQNEKAFEKRMLDLYIAGGGDLDQFTLLKQVANTDLTELSKIELTKELKAKGFNDEEIAAIQKERYYQISEDELEQLDDETAKDFAKRKAEYGKEKLESKAAYIKENAKDFLDNLKEAVNQKDLFTQKESEFVSNVEAHFKGVERKMALELGKAGDADISPVEYEVPEEIIAEAEAILKNPTTRKQLLFNTTDGSLNLKSIAELVLKAKMFDSAAKTSYLTGATREVEKFESIFPKNPNALGVGGNNQANTGKPGKIVSAGQPQRFKPAVNQ